MFKDSNCILLPASIIKLIYISNESWIELYSEEISHILHITAISTSFNETDCHQLWCAGYWWLE